MGMKGREVDQEEAAATKSFEEERTALDKAMKEADEQRRALEAEKAAFEQRKAALGTEVASVADQSKQSKVSGVLTGPASSWNVAEVIEFLESLGFAHVVDGFRENGVDGEMLSGLSEEELVEELKLTKLQAKKVRQRLPH